MKSKVQMKKLILMVAMLLATSFTAIADDTNSNSVSMVEAYDVNVNINSLVRYLGLSNDQIDSVESIQKVFTDCLKYAAVMEEGSRKNMIKNAIDYDLKNLRYVLDEKQYRKYVVILNVTLNNRGISVE